MTTAVITLALAVAALGGLLAYAFAANIRLHDEIFDLWAELARSDHPPVLLHETASGTPVHDAVRRERA